MNSRPPRRPAALLAPLAVGLLVAACSTVIPATPSSSPSAPSPALPTSTPAHVGFVIRASWTQALPPRSLFGSIPAAVVTTGGRVLTPGGVPAVYPKPLVAPIVERPISPKGIATLLQVAKDAGILGVGDDFTGGAILIGGAAARLQIAVDGVTSDLVGDPNTPVACPLTGNCPDAVPGTPAAFTRFWHRVLDLAGWLEPELGPEQAHVPASYAVIVGPPPEPWPGAVPMVWPVTDPALDAFGAAVRGEPGTRCGIAAGDLAAALGPLFAGATQLTPFVATASASATHGLTVRPLLPGDDDPCAPIVE